MKKHLERDWRLRTVLASYAFLWAYVPQVPGQSITDESPGLQAAKGLVAMINCKFNDETFGAGVVFAVSNDYVYIATMFHVVRQTDPLGRDDRLATDLKVRFENDRTTPLPAEHVIASSEGDLAVIRVKVADTNFNFAHIGDPNLLGNGALVYAIGQPGGTPWGVTYQASTISNVGSKWLDLQSVFIVPGHSGGALIDQHGHIVGLAEETGGNTAKAMRIDFAVNVLREDLKLPVQLTAEALTPTEETASTARPLPPIETPLKAPAPGESRANPKDGLPYVWIPAGSFRMGCSEQPDDTGCQNNEFPSHDIAISKGFWMGQTEVTQQAYRRVSGKRNPSQFNGLERPVENVNWDDAVAYCSAAGGLRLPTEAEWEYAARAGTLSKTYGELDDIAWHSANSGGQTHDVGLKAANAWNLFDMLGNVAEWTADLYDSSYYKSSRQSDPKGPPGLKFPSGEFDSHVLRGGSWRDEPETIGASERHGVDSSSGYILFSHVAGFRCAGDPPGPS